MDSGITELTTVGGRPFSIEKARQNGYVNKFDGLSLRDKQELELLWINNFDEVKTYNELFPDKKDITKDESKRKYFYINNYKRKKVYVNRFFEEMINDRFKSKCFTKENIALQTLELHRAAMNKGNEKIAAEYWKILLKLLGLTRDGPIIANMMPDVIKIIERGGRPLEEGIQFTKIDSMETTGEEINKE